MHSRAASPAAANAHPAPRTPHPAPRIEGSALSTPPDARTVLLTQLKAFLAESETILAAWDAYSDKHTDDEGWPLDEVSYGWRMVQRDSEAWRAFLAVWPGARQLLATAAVQLQHLSAGDIAPHWPSHLRELNQALERLEELRRDHAEVREARRTSGPVPEGELVDSVAERNEEAWSHLDTWAAKGHVFLDVHAAAQKAPIRRAPAPAPAPEPARPAERRR
ncbi:hypothetical protein ACGF1Z_26780 [Streptomyces sp. NPDC048018]|uniref:hypothetical protein n=1 Tax=Streptomyces sp. NPDC048018 TaxID=3365499 RepID=UPI00371990F1